MGSLWAGNGTRSWERLERFLNYLNVLKVVIDFRLNLGANYPKREERAGRKDMKRLSCFKRMFAITVDDSEKRNDEC
jgi:hypothetical protein